MAERIVSPGVFTREKDLSFLPAGVANIGAAIVGPTLKGPSFVPTQITSFSEFQTIFGGYTKDYYTPYTVNEYLRSAGSVTVVRVGYLQGYSANSVNLVASGSGLFNPAKVIATYLPSKANTGGSLSGSFTGVTGSHKMSEFTINFAGSNTTASFGSMSAAESAINSTNYIGTKIPPSALTDTIDGAATPVYTYKFFRTYVSESLAASGAPNASNISMSLQVLSSAEMDFSSGGETFSSSDNSSTIDGSAIATSARTPDIIDQDSNALFKIFMRSDGTITNNHYVVIRDVVQADPNNTAADYSEFGLSLHNADGDELENYTKLVLDPASPNFIAKVIGDQFQTVNDDGEITVYGDYPNRSSRIRVGNYNADTLKSRKSSQPFGHAALLQPVITAASVNTPTASINPIQAAKNSQAQYNPNIPYGTKFNTGYFSEADVHDSLSYLSPIPKGAVAGGNRAFLLSQMKGFGAGSQLTSLRTTYGTAFASAAQNLTITSSAQQQKFTVPMQHGFDGISPTKALNTGNDITATNTMGFDCSTQAASGSVAWKRGINAVSNPDEIDINMLVTPGLIHSLHTNVTNHAIDKVESRADAFYVMDGSAWNDSVASAVSNIQTLDTNYAATYYPWVKIDDPNTGEGVWVPPSVVIPGVIAFTDSVAHEWFAPAGLNRGGLASVRMAKKKLTHTDRDRLYDGRVNPIATFPGQGVVVFGQKTLQARPSALDRINVRRLLIRLKKFIASSSRFLVFEQNDSSTRTRFLNIVNPFLESVQANSGLSAFKVVMDESNNTPDVIDRNQLVGQIFIQPTRTAEFIVLDFSVLPTGAAFPE